MEPLKLELSIRDSNALKGIALVFLLIHHLFYINNGLYDDIEIMGHGIINSIGITCKVCVAIFIFLSGYGLGISNPVHKKLNPRSFYIRRFTKLFMNYWLIWLLFVPAGILVFDMTFPKVYGEENTLLYAVFDFFGILNITGRYGYNPTWWFYSCIITLYVLFPIISTSIRKWPFSIWIILVLSVCIIKVPIVYINPIRYYLFPFVIGILFSNQLIFNKLPPPDL